MLCSQNWGPRMSEVKEEMVRTKSEGADGGDAESGAC